jgi:3-oxoadipate enol-lactonase
VLTRRQIVEGGLAAAMFGALWQRDRVSAANPRFRVEGEGEPVLLIAGFSCDLSVWDVLAPALVAKGCRTIRFNNLGVGRGVELPPAVTIAAMAADTVRLLDELSLPSVHVVGHSMGGQIAQELALSAPRRARSLSILSSWAKPSDKLTATLFDFADLAGKLTPGDWQRMLLPWMLTGRAYADAALIEGAVRGYEDNADRLSPAMLTAQARAIAESDTSSRLAAITTPTLVAVGEEDALTPPALSRAISAGIAGAEFALLPGAHGNIVEAAPVLAQRLASFITAL